MGEVLEAGEWRKSSYSTDINCVEWGMASSSVVAVRDSKDRFGPALGFSRAAWGVFTRALTAESLLPNG
ncbi:hypothetical protein JCM9534A_42050 [Catenuloplanes indicus JCM 9534]